MKKILGNILIVLNIFAANYQIDISKQDPYIKEPITINLKFFEKKKEEVNWISFEPVKSKNYDVILLNKKSRDFGYEFLYLIFPLKEGKIKIDYKLRLKKAPIEEIQNKILGTGYEQTTPIEGTIYTIKVKPSILEVKPVKKVDLYGNFHIKALADKKIAQEFEPIYYTFTIKGTGYPPQIKDIFPNKDNLKILKDKPVKNIKYTKNGAQIEYIFQYAIISDKSFTIPSVKFKEFDYKEYLALKTKPISIEIKKSQIKADKIDNPPKLKPFYKSLVWILKYFAIFIAGVVSGILIYLLIRKEEYEKIIKAKDEKELLTFITVKYPNCLEDIKNRLDSAIVNNKNINLLKVKKEIIKEIRKKGCK